MRAEIDQSGRSRSELARGCVVFYREEARLEEAVSVTEENRRQDKH